jgi:hypothetical protein
MRKLLFLLLVHWILFACSSTQKQTAPDLTNAPEWVRKAPNDAAYYHGVGSSVKTTAMDYKEKAKQNALSDMASNISVNISNSSVFSQFETDRKFSEYYRDNIKTTTKNYLEGYEMVEAYETRDRYWVYYRLSKSEHERLKNARIQSALLKSEGDYHQMTQARESGQTAEAIYSAIRAIEKIRDYLGEDLRTNKDGVDQSYSARLFADLTSLVNNIRIVYLTDKLQVKRGQAPPNVGAVIMNDKEQRLSNISVVASWSYSPGTKSELVSDASGTLRISAGRVGTHSKNETITTMVDFGKMVRETTSDPIVRKLLSVVKMREFVLPVEVMTVSFTVTASEKTPGQEVHTGKVVREISSVLNRDGFILQQEPSGDGLAIVVESTLAPVADRSGKYTATLMANYTVLDPAGNKLFDQKITDITGIGMSPAESVADAFNALSGKIKISVIPSMYRQLNLQ